MIQFGETGSTYKIALTLVFICIYLVGYNNGIGSLVYILAHEVFNGEHEKVVVVGTGIATMCMWFTTIILALFFIPVVLLTNQAVPWFIFSGFSMLALLLSIFVLKETSPAIIEKRKAKTLAQPAASDSHNDHVNIEMKEEPPKEELKTVNNFPDDSTHRNSQGSTDRVSPTVIQPALDTTLGMKEV